MIVKRQVDQYWCERREHEAKLDKAKEQYLPPKSRWYPDMFPKILSPAKDFSLTNLHGKFLLANQKYEIAKAAYEKQTGEKYFPPVI